VREAEASRPTGGTSERSLGVHDADQRLLGSAAASRRFARRVDAAEPAISANAFGPRALAFRRFWNRLFVCRGAPQYTPIRRCHKR